MNETTQLEFVKELPNIRKRLLECDPCLIIPFRDATVKWEEIVKSPYVALIGAIIGQKISYTRARKIRGNVYQQFGINFTPVEIESASDTTFRQCGLSENKVAIVRRVNSHLRSEKLKLTTSDEIRGLISITGIGPWTIKTVLLTSMLDLTVFPESDLFIKKKMRKLYNLDHLPTKGEIQEKVKLWNPYQGIVAWYLWRWFS